MDRNQLHTLNNGGVEGVARVGAHQAGTPWGALAPGGTMHRQYRAVPPLIGPNGAQFTAYLPQEPAWLQVQPDHGCDRPGAGGDHQVLRLRASY